MNLSIIIPTKNRCRQLRRLLDGLLPQIHPSLGEIEVIIVDNQSTDMTPQTIIEYRDRFGPHVHYARESTPGPASARNCGIRLSRGEIIAFLDDDAIVWPNWVSVILKTFQEFPDADAIGGKIMAEYPENIPPWVKNNNDILNGPILNNDHGPRTWRYQWPIAFTSANLAIKREIFQGCGLFHPRLGLLNLRLGEDAEMFHRLKRAGKRIYYCGALGAVHPVERKRIRWPYLINWYFREGRWMGYYARHYQPPERHSSFCGAPLRLYPEALSYLLKSLINFLNTRERLWNGLCLMRTLGQIADHNLTWFDRLLGKPERGYPSWDTKTTTPAQRTVPSDLDSMMVAGG